MLGSRVDSHPTGLWRLHDAIGKHKQRRISTASDDDDDDDGAPVAADEDDLPLGGDGGDDDDEQQQQTEGEDDEDDEATAPPAEAPKQAPAAIRATIPRSPSRRKVRVVNSLKSSLATTIKTVHSPRGKAVRW